MAKKLASRGASQNGQRRQELHKNQDNRGDKKNPPEFENFKGEEIK